MGARASQWRVFARRSVSLGVFDDAGVTARASVRRIRPLIHPVKMSRFSK
jgi:hypothetical protein